MWLYTEWLVKNTLYGNGLYYNQQCSLAFIPLISVTCSTENSTQDCGEGKQCVQDNDMDYVCQGIIEVSIYYNINIFFLFLGEGYNYHEKKSFWRHFNNYF